MKPNADDALSTRSPGNESGVPGASHGTPPGIVAQRLVAVPWRHAGLIAACAVAGGLASATFWLQPAPARVAAVKPRMQAIQDAPPPSVAGVVLRLDLEPAPAVARSGATRTADATQTFSAALRLDDARESDEIDAVLRQAPPAAGYLTHARSERAPTMAGTRPNAMLPGLAAGLLLGLLVAALRELGGQRMRSPREAEWALGAPVLGAIPTLSARARDALLERPQASPDAA